MSVVPEMIVARQMGVKTVVLTWTSNMASGMKGSTLSHPDVLSLGAKVAGDLRIVLDDFLRQI